MKRLEDAVLFVIVLSIFVWCAACATVKDNEANLIKVEKSSPAEEANRWADFGGKLISFVKGQ